MIKKKFLITLAIIAAIAVPFSVFAATSNTPAAKTVRGFFGIDTSKLNDQQKSDIKDYSTKMANLQKEFINKMGANGSMTKEQGEAAIKKVDDMLAKGGENGFAFGMRKGGFGKGEGFGKNPIDISKLTSGQISDLSNIYKKMAEQQKATIGTMVSNGILTKEQGDAQTKAVDDRLAKIGTDATFIIQGGFEGFGGFGRVRIDPSKLTVQQKADLKAASTKMADLQKELVNKLVTDSLLTKDQGAAVIKKIEAIQSEELAGGFPKDSGMRKGKFGNRGNHKAQDIGGPLAPNTKKYF